MSPINFDILRNDYPEYGPVWAALQGWFAKNWRKQYVELSVLLRALPQVKRLDLILALEAMIDKEMLKTSYRVKAPAGYLLEGSYDEPDRIPEELPDRDHSGQIKTAEADVVSGYRWEPSDAA